MSIDVYWLFSHKFLFNKHIEEEEKKEILFDPTSGS
jgi:hypothetical protein